MTDQFTTGLLDTDTGRGQIKILFGRFERTGNWYAYMAVNLDVIGTDMCTDALRSRPHGTEAAP